jgi:hypothetical protein
MWLFTPFGFFSVVQKKNESDLTIRSRVRADLEALQARYLPKCGQIIDGGGTDYQFRVKTSHTDLAGAMAQIVKDIKYNNFKDAVEDEQGRKRHDVYLKVWRVLDQELT